MTAVVADAKPGDVRTDRRFFPSLDGYRALAALLVVLCHVALISGFNGRSAHTFGPFLARADIGVAFFFLLSGFLIYRPFVVNHVNRTKPMGTRAFYRRRALRILPAYWVALTIVGFVMHAPGFTGPHEPWAHYLLVHVFFLNQVVGGPVQQSWSLSTEISFYLFIPFYAMAIRRLGARAGARRAFLYEFLGAGALIVASVGLQVYLVAIHVSANRIGQMGTWLPFRLDAFGIGMMMAVVSVWMDQPNGPSFDWLSSRWLPALSWLTAAVLFWVMCTHLGLPLGPLFSAKQALIVNVAYPVVAFFALLPGMFGPERQGLFRRFMQLRVVVWLGLISYGIYIWHEAFLAPNMWFRWTGHQELNAPFWPLLFGTLALTIPVAAASYYLVERPALKFKNRRRPKPSSTEPLR